MVVTGGFDLCLGKIGFLFMILEESKIMRDSTTTLLFGARRSIFLFIRRA